jgi:hypothetical protein
MTTVIPADKLQKAYDFLHGFFKNDTTEYHIDLNSVTEYDYCYAAYWFPKEWLSGNVPKEEMVMVGVGRIVISKINDRFNIEGSYPARDWIHEFELAFRDLEEYWQLSIEFDKRQIRFYKSLFECTTSEAMKLPNENGQIILTSKEKGGFYGYIQALKKQQTVKYELELLIRNV